MKEFYSDSYVVGHDAEIVLHIASTTCLDAPERYFRSHCVLAILVNIIYILGTPKYEFVTSMKL